MPDTKPVVKLLGKDGNAFYILGVCQIAARRAGWSQEQIDAVMAEMTGGNYDHLLQTALTYFEVV